MVIAKYPRAARVEATCVPRSSRFSFAALLLSLAACSDRVAERNPDYRPPRITVVDGVTWVQNVAARERFVVRRGLPERPRFLFAGVRPAAHDRAGRQAMLTPRGERLMLFDREGR